MACGILALLPGMEPVPLAVEVQSLNHWTTREIPAVNVLILTRGFYICYLSYLVRSSQSF